MPRQNEWLQVSYSYLSLLNAPSELKTNWKSNAWAIQLMGQEDLGKKSHFSFGYGVGFSNFNYHNNLRITTTPSSGAQYYWLPADSNYTKNTFSTSFIDVPLELRYRSSATKNGRYFRLYFGALAGIRVNSKSHFVVGDYSVKHHNLSDLPRWHYGLYARTGFWVFNLYVCYNLNPTFAKTPASFTDLSGMHSLQVGLNVSL